MSICVNKPQSRYQAQLLYGTGVVCEGFSDSLENGNVTVSVSGTAYREVVNYACDMGYNLVGSAGRICQEDGTLSGRQPVCSSMLSNTCLLAVL